MTAKIKQRLEYLRGELRAERISTGELVELQSLAKHIDSGDVELLEAAGVPEKSAERVPKTLAQFKKLPSGTKLILLENQVHEGLGKRTILGFVDRGQTMTLRNEQGHTCFLTLSGEFFSTENTFGFKEDGLVAAEYKFDAEV
jgi:hypothetical protein